MAMLTDNCTLCSLPVQCQVCSSISSSILFSSNMQSTGSSVNVQCRDTLTQQASREGASQHGDAQHLNGRRGARTPQRWHGRAMR